MAQIRFKAIIPKKLNTDAMMKALTGEMKDIHKEVDKDFDSTVKTWDNKPKFDRKFKSSKSQIRFFTGSSNEIYGYVSGGTKPHRIVPKRAKVLKFKGTYSAKTSPGSIQAGPGGASGADVFSKGVMHPGTKPRNFDKQIAKKWEKNFRRRLVTTMQEVAKKSGHSI